MNKEILIQRGLSSLQKLPAKKINEVIAFIDLISERHQDDIDLQKDIQSIVSQSNSFAFLKDEKDLYTINDLKEKY